MNPAAKKHEQRYGLQSSQHCTNNYGQAMRAVNVTVSAPERQASVKAEREAVAKRIAEHEEYKRVKKGRQSITHILPAEHPDQPEHERPTTTTERIEH